MQIPLQITFRDIEPSAAIEANIREKAAKLDQFYNQIMSCMLIITKASSTRCILI